MVKKYKIENISVPEIGQVVSATYIGMSDDQYLFNVPGYKDDIRIDNRVSESKYFKNLSIGDTIDVHVVNISHKPFMIKGSVASLYESMAHANLKSLDENEPVTITVKTVNPAGYDVDIIHNGVTLPGFMPNTLAGINKLHDVNSIVGETFKVMIESYSHSEGTYIVSRRKYLQTLIPEEIKKLEYNTVYEGHVTGTTPFGVFVEFNGCLTGMIHKANINPEWSDRISDIPAGCIVDFYIKEVIKDKIILTQILRESLWDNIKIGQVIKGSVKDIKQFGTLINLDDETMGLITTSEMERLGKKFKVDQKVKVKVTNINRLSRKIFLTLA
jgi:ribosomal protein S1